MINATDRAMAQFSTIGLLSLPPGLMAWIGLLLLVVSASVFFARRHKPARWLLAGGVVHAAVILTLEMTGWIVVRNGTVSLGHVLLWGPAFVRLVSDRSGRANDRSYRIWCWIAIAVLSGSFYFDVVDAWIYVRESFF